MKMKSVKDTQIICSVDVVPAQVQHGYRAPALFCMNTDTPSQGHLWYKTITVVFARCRPRDNKAPGSQAGTIKTLCFRYQQSQGEPSSGIPRFLPQGLLMITWGMLMPAMQMQTLCEATASARICQSSGFQGKY